MVATRSVLLYAALTAVALATPLDDYINKPESVYGWKDTGKRFPLKGGATAHMLNVTSLTWLNETEAYNPYFKGSGTNVWWHQVAVAVPSKIRITNTSLVLLTGNCNKNEWPSGVDADEEYLELAGIIAELTGSVMAVVYQIPNCPIVFPSDPSATPRQEDAQIAWAWKEYAAAVGRKDPDAARWVSRLPMAKASFQSMRAVEEYTKQAGLADIATGGWVVSGASKRGWTTWMVGAATCPDCPTVIGIAPLVPIVPDLNQIVHRQYQSLGGFTFAFKDYKEAGLFDIIDSPDFRTIEAISDPGNAVYAKRLARLPKYVIVSSDDEFMQLDWTPLWYDKMAAQGETHLLIIPNTEHSLTTGIPELITTMPTMYLSISKQQTQDARPSFDYSRDEASGELTITVDAKWKTSKVVLHYGQTTGKQRRDFRWVRIGGTPDTEKCSLPNIPSNASQSGVPPGALCFQPIIWREIVLEPVDRSGDPSAPKDIFTYKATPPAATREGHWVGYYIEALFPSRLEHGITDFQFSTPGFVWPDTFPFEDKPIDQTRGNLV